MAGPPGCFVYLPTESVAPGPKLGFSNLNALEEELCFVLDHGSPSTLWMMNPLEGDLEDQQNVSGWVPAWSSLFTVDHTTQRFYCGGGILYEFDAFPFVTAVSSRGLNGHALGGVAVNAAIDRYCFGDLYTNYVYVRKLSDNSLVDTLSLGEPYQLVIADGDLYACHYNSAIVTQYDGLSATVKETYDLSGFLPIVLGMAYNGEYWAFCDAETLYCLTLPDLRYVIPWCNPYTTLAPLECCTFTPRTLRPTTAPPSTEPPLSTIRVMPKFKTCCNFKGQIIVGNLV